MPNARMTTSIARPTAEKTAVVRNEVKNSRII